MGKAMLTEAERNVMAVSQKWQDGLRKQSALESLGMAFGPRGVKGLGTDLGLNWV